ncbi:stearoyl-CoA 9-desaturase [Carbonactinospora thermoautotrophica]|uniref:Stearoyl-CoA 9-desaturase n=1 Tax=Carbonactinospora thermoautotrophica TaxID=1469144 RepID=A0A132N4M7_9ACTN|nr:acyl-CoA desaturase [Carbonactinospora thermoautotrophica]KWX05088.1 stearoyl-CoA 9-desaturase [Carbonactinospora thermoautotrophica]KWX06585.1 stearoyl-CoA 9-desaturase [Carbonactinospora thermoautotrophica]
MTPVPPSTLTSQPAQTTDAALEEAVKATLGDEVKGPVEQITLALFIIVPFLALVAAVPVAWGGWLGWSDVVIAAVMYAVAGHGVTVGYHRHFTHGSFRAKRPLRIALAIAGSLAIEGPVVRWVADHRKHHQFSDKEGDPHSPWRYGDTVPALLKGLFYAHLGWLFEREQTPARKYAPDLLQDKDVVRVSRAFPYLVAVSLLLPPLAGGLWTMSWQGALTAFFWGSLVRVALLHHVTWSINSICHAVGMRPFKSRDKSGNVWWLAVLSMGESWHNLHHADPTSARHGVLRGQVDSSARLIWIFEKLGWAYDVRWPTPERLAARRA